MRILFITLLLLCGCDQKSTVNIYSDDSDGIIIKRRPDGFTIANYSTEKVMLTIEADTVEIEILPSQTYCNNFVSSDKCITIRSEEMDGIE